MKANIRNIHQLKAYLEALKVVYLLMIVEYIKQLQIVVLSSLDNTPLVSASIMGPPARGEFIDGIVKLTNDNVPPEVYINSIPDGAISIFPDDNITILMNEQIDPDTVNTETVIVRDSKGNIVEGTVYLAADGMTIVFVPRYGYKYGETYTIEINGVKDWGGNLIVPYTSTFSTFRPEILSTIDVPYAMAIDKYKNNIVVKGVNEGLGLDLVHSSLMNIIDVSDPREPFIKGSTDLGGYILDLKSVPDMGDFMVAVGGRMTTYGILDLVDVTDPYYPEFSTEPLYPKYHEFIYLSWSKGYGTPPLNVPYGSGVPNEVAVLGTNAYVATTGIGIQAIDLTQVDINLPQETAQANAIGGTITGNSYSAISTIRNNLLAIRSGELTILSPQLTVISKVTGLELPYAVTGVEAFPIDLDNDGNTGSFEDEDGDPMTSAQEQFDLALVLSSNGIVIIDVTDPTEPKKMDMIPASAGRIAVDRFNRLAYTSTFSVISLKDLRPLSNPANYGVKRDSDNDGIDDRVLYTMPEASGIDMVLNDYGDLAYIADYSGGEVKIVRVGLSEIYIETHDREFSKVKLNWDDYYPALGDKTITIGTQNEFLKGEVVTCEVLEPENNKPTCTPVDAAITQDLKMRFQLSGTDLTPSTSATAGVDEIKLRFYIGQTDNPNSEVRGTYNVKNNSNTNLKEVLEGEAVFAIDIDSTGDVKTGENHQGKTTGSTDNERGLDFVQKMINHIIVPLRTPANEANIKNTLPVYGYYGDMTKQALEAIINGGADPTGTTLKDTKVSHHINEENSLNTFKKLAKDYSGLNDADIGKVIDKEILIGLNESDEDKHPTDDKDIGIYELYGNDDWDEDGISNYIEVENGIDPIEHSDNYFPKFDSDASTVPTNIDNNPYLSYPRGTHSDGRLVNSLKIPNNSKGYYQQSGADSVNTDNYAIPDVLNRVEEVAKIWEERHPDLTPLMKNIFTTGDGYINLDQNDDDGNGIADVNTGTEVRTGINDLSLENGGEFCTVLSNGNTLCHNSHQNGLDVDVRYVRNDNKEGSLDLSKHYESYSQELTEELIGLFKTVGGAVKIFIDEESDIDEDDIIQHLPGHKDHLHVTFPNPNPPYGNIDLETTIPQLEETTGFMVSTISTKSPIKDKYGLSMFEGFKVEVRTDVGTIYYNNQSQGQYAKLPLDSEGNITFQLKRSLSGTAMVTVETPNIYNQGQATGTVKIEFP